MQMSNADTCNLVIESFLHEWQKLGTLVDKMSYMLMWPSMAVFVEFVCKQLFNVLQYNKWEIKNKISTCGVVVPPFVYYRPDLSFKFHL